MFYKGKVTDKITGRPVANIAVTDGKNTVFTNERGEYELGGWERSRLISVGALTKCHDDWFVYTGGESGVYDFAITPLESKKDESVFLHVADSEIENRRDVSSLLAVMSEAVSQSGADFFVHTGDICRQDGLIHHYKVTPNDKVGCPVRYCIGNHDYCDGDYGEQLFEKLYGPTWYSFDFAGTHFVFLSIHKGEFPSGYELCDQWVWLENDLKNKPQGMPLVIFEHDSCDDEREFIIDQQNVRLDLKEHGLIAWVCGHFHYNYAQNHGGVYSICTTTPDFGGIDSSVAGVREIKVCGKKVTSKLRYVRYDLKKADEPIFKVQMAGHCEFCDPVTDGEYIYAATSDDSLPSECGIYCIDKNSGGVKWSTMLEHGFKSALTLYNGYIYAICSNGVLYCIDKETGKVTKTADTLMKKPVYARLSPSVADGIVFTGRHNHVCGFDLGTFQKVWERKTVKGGAVSTSKAVCDEQSGKHFISILWKELIEIDAKTGEDRIVTASDGNNTASGTPTVDGEYIYSAGYNSISKIDKRTGETVALLDVGSQVDTVGGPTVDGDLLYFPTAQRGVVAIDKNSFELLREYPCDCAGVITTPYIMGSVKAVETRPIIVGSKLIFAASDGSIRVYDKNTAEPIKVIYTGSPILAQPIIDEGFVFVCCFDGELYKYEI